MAGDTGITAPATQFEAAERYETNQGGAGTYHGSANANAFSQPAANITLEQRLDFFVGNGFFHRIWVSSPSSTTSADGLGPLYNARGCQNCHLKDGRGHAPAANWPDDNAVSMFLRLSIPPRDAAEQALLAQHRINTVPDPVYGGQLQDFAVPGLSGEGRMAIAYEDIPVVLADGQEVSLRAPTYTITDLAYGPLHPELMVSPRVAPPMIGLGLLEAIDPADILARVDENDADGDGISGRANTVWDEEAQAPALGRFGWKAGEPGLAQQNAHAFGGDVGIASPLAPGSWGDCTQAQAACMEAPHGGDAEGYEASATVMEKLLFYTRNLAVPARRDVDDATVLEGKRLFYGAGCIACHKPKYVTMTLEDRPELSHQLIWPYSDLLLHDMGEGLADHRPEGMAGGSEWRTPPLWGIGLTATVSGHTQFLHDGRARNLVEAILWHGGEAQDSRDRFAAMPAQERAALITFLESL
ncbi:MAG: c-type cytochrome [Proteobacteria bacterium]|nr:c-type cytochrome [Pseudomonadota bacterium]